MLRATALMMVLALPAQAQPLGPSLEGEARMGLAFTRAPAWAGQRETGLRMTSRARLTFHFRGETDRGTAFGAEIRLDPNQRGRPRSVLSVGN